MQQLAHAVPQGVRVPILPMIEWLAFRERLAEPVQIHHFPNGTREHPCDEPQSQKRHRHTDFDGRTHDAASENEKRIEQQRKQRHRKIAGFSLAHHAERNRLHARVAVQLARLVRICAINAELPA